MTITTRELAKMIDHSLLNPTITWDQLEAGCLLAVDYGVASVCIMPYALRRCAELIQGSDVHPSTTIGFPHGVHTAAIKLAEAERAIDDGARELDMVVNISKVLSGDWAYVREEIQSVVEAAHARQAQVKVIFENAYLQDEQKIRLCEICGDVGADWVKTSTGFAPSGAVDTDLILMRKHSPSRVQVKAAGGVRTLDRLLEVRALGVTRAGATVTQKILDEARSRYGA